MTPLLSDLLARPIFLPLFSESTIPLKITLGLSKIGTCINYQSLTWLVYWYFAMYVNDMNLMLLFNFHGKQMWSCRDSQLTNPLLSWADLNLQVVDQHLMHILYSSNWELSRKEWWPQRSFHDLSHGKNATRPEYQNPWPPVYQLKAHIQVSYWAQLICSFYIIKIYYSHVTLDRTTGDKNIPHNITTIHHAMEKGWFLIKFKDNHRA